MSNIFNILIQADRQTCYIQTYTYKLVHRNKDCPLDSILIKNNWNNNFQEIRKDTNKEEEKRINSDYNCDGHREADRQTDERADMDWQAYDTSNNINNKKDP